MGNNETFTATVIVTIDITAVQCSNTTFSATGTFPCTAHTICTNDLVEVYPPTNTVDRDCRTAKQRADIIAKDEAAAAAAAAKQQDGDGNASGASSGGVVAGIIVALAVLLALVVLLMKRKQQHEKDSAEEAGDLEMKGMAHVNGGGFDGSAGQDAPDDMATHTGNITDSGNLEATYEMANGIHGREYMDASGAGGAGGAGEQTYEMASGAASSDGPIYALGGEGGEEEGRGRGEATYEMANSTGAGQGATYAMATDVSKGASDTAGDEEDDLYGMASATEDGNTIYETAAGGKALNLLFRSDSTHNPVYSMGDAASAPAEAMYAFADGAGTGNDNFNSGGSHVDAGDGPGGDPVYALGDAAIDSAYGGDAPVYAVGAAEGDPEDAAHIDYSISGSGHDVVRLSDADQAAIATAAAATYSVAAAESRKNSFAEMGEDVMAFKSGIPLGERVRRSISYEGALNTVGKEEDEAPSGTGDASTPLPPSAPSAPSAHMFGTVGDVSIDLNSAAADMVEMDETLLQAMNQSQTLKRAMNGERVLGSKVSINMSALLSGGGGGGGGAVALSLELAGLAGDVGEDSSTDGARGTVATVLVEDDMSTPAEEV
jgi:type II secretory pathway pseudopilin PulG